jgi:hypothetical protein
VQRNEVPTFLLGEPTVTVRMLTPLLPTPSDDYRCRVSMTEGDETVEFEAGWTGTAHQGESLCDRLVRLALSFPNDGFRLRNVKFYEPHVFGSR